MPGACEARSKNSKKTPDSRFRPRRLRKRQQCSSAVVCVNRGSPLFPDVGAVSGDSGGGQGVGHAIATPLPDCYIARMKASCQCGQLRVAVPGPTIAVVACHCVACQKRSGSPFGEAAYYSHDQVTIEGKSKHFARATDAGGTFDQFFCPECGTTVFMKGTKNPDMTGIPIGLFDDMHEMQPVRSVWEESRHSWVDIPTAVQHFQRARID